MSSATYTKPKGSNDLPKWFKDIRAGSDFMPNPVKIKPMSYTALATVSPLNRPNIYAAGGQSTKLELGTKYHRPTEEVAGAIRKNFTVWQDIKNLGGEVKEHGGNLLKGIIDVLSRPGYTIRNMYLQNAKQNYLTEGSAGGTKMTGGEHLQAIFDMTPFGLIGKALKGQGDDMARAGWAGFSGKAKTGTGDILKTVAPEWTKTHSKLATGLSVFGDIAIDPITWVTMGVNPGSITRLGVAGGKLLSFDRAGAASVMRDTIFTPTGLKQTAKTFKSDLVMGEYNSLMRKAANAERRGDKAAAKVAKGKAVRKSQQVYALKAKEYADKAADVAAKDLQGSELAWKAIKKNLNPLQAMQTASRFTTGAKAGSDFLKGAATLNAAADIHYAATVDKIKDKEVWNNYWASWSANPRDIEYWHNDIKYTVKLSEAKSYEDWLKRIVQESAPVAAYAETGSKAARSRRGRIHSTEARGRAFGAALRQDVSNRIAGALPPDALRDYQNLNQFGAHFDKHSTVKPEEVDDPSFVKVSSEELHGMTFDELKQKAREAWTANNPSQWSQSHSVIVVNHAGEAKKVPLRTLKRFTNQRAAEGADVLNDAEALARRTPQQAAEDTILGVSDDVAARRQALIEEHGRRVETARAEAEAARNRASASIGEMHMTMTPDHVRTVNAILSKIDDTLSTEERAAAEAILNDTTLTMEQRIAKLLNDDSFDQEAVNAVTESVFGFSIENGALKLRISEGVEPEKVLAAIPDIIKEVIQNRWVERVQGTGLEKASGYALVDGKVTPIPKDRAADAAGMTERQRLVDGVWENVGPSKVDATRDMNGEIGLMALDGIRSALEAAVYTDIMNSHPTHVFNAINQAMANFVELTSADTKLQVQHILNNVFGKRLPEDLVPTLENVTAKLEPGSPDRFVFKNARGEPVDLVNNSSNPWRKLAIEMQTWVTDALPFLDLKRLPGNSNGFDITDVQTQLNDVIKSPMPAVSTPVELNIVKEHNAIVDSIVHLEEVNSTGTGFVNRYSMLDFIMHSDAIVKAQETSLVVTKAGGRSYVRMNAGRLSSLDSFNFLDDEYMEGVNAIAKLKRRLKSTDPLTRQLAQQALTQLFIKHGGMDFINDVTDIGSPNFTRPFSTLGAHAALKERALATTNITGFGAKYAADLMESMWAVPTVNHEWTKALHHATLSRAAITGANPASIAAELNADLNQFFKNHDRLRKLINPKNTALENRSVAGESGVSIEDIDDAIRRSVGRQGKELQKQWGGNRLNVSRNKPMVETAASNEFKLGEITEVKPADIRISRLPAERGPKQAALIRALDAANIPDDLRREVGRHFSKITHVSVIPNNGIVIHLKGQGDIKPKAILFSADSTSPNRFIGIQPPANLNELVSSVNDILKGKTELSLHTPYAAVDYGPSAAMRKTEKLSVPRETITPAVPGKEFNPLIRETAPAVEDILKERQAAKALKNIEAVTEDELLASAGLSRTPDETVTTPTEASALSEEAAVAGETAPTGAPETNGPEGTTDSVPEADALHVSDIEYTEEELDAIRTWISEKYADTSPQELAAVMTAHVNTLSADTMMAQAHVIGGLSDLRLQNRASMRMAGIPFMPVGNPNNATHSLAGVTALAQHRSRAFRFWNDRMNPAVNPEHWMAKARLHLTKESQLLEGTLFNIRRTVVNAVGETRKFIVNRLNSDYKRALNGEYKFGPFNGMSRKEKYREMNKTLFDAHYTGDFSEWDQVDGFNPVKTLIADMEGTSFTVFGGMSDDRILGQIRVFNNYLPKKFRLTENELNNLDYLVTVKKLRPYTHEWFNEVAKVSGTKLNRQKLLSDTNIAELHYELLNAGLRIEEGRALYRGVWAEFSTAMSPTDVAYWNNVVSPSTVDAQGNPMRGKLISLNDIHTNKKSPHHFLDHQIPSEFLNPDTPRYIQEEFLPEIKVLFNYMEGSHNLNEELGVGFLNKVLSYFKASVTIYKIPTYPVRNTLADVFMSAMDGLTQPKYYKFSASIMQNAHRDSKAIDDLNLTGIIDEGFMKSEYAKASHDPSTVAPDTGPGLTNFLLRTEDGTDIRLNDKQVMDLYEELGLGQNRVAGELKDNLAAARESAIGVKAGAAHDTLRKLNDWREDWARIAHFLYALEKEAPMGGDLHAIARRAAQRVIKHHFDYNDVSLFERNVVAPFIPFYKWVRNIIPYTLAAVVTKPYMLKAEQASAQLLGAAINDDPNDPRTDFVIPEYISRENPVPIGNYADPDGNKFVQWMTLSLPLSETLTGNIMPTVDPWIDPSGGSFANRFKESGEGVARGIGAMSNPVVKAGIQAMTGQMVWPTSSSPEKAGDSWMDTLANVIPGWATLSSMEQSVSNIAKNKDNQYTGMNSTGQLLKELGIVGLANNSEKAQLGEMRRMNDILRGERDVEKAKLSEKLKKRWPHLTPEQRKIVVDAYVEQMRGQNNGNE